MDTVVELKQWFLNKCGINSKCKDERDNSLGGALTPNTIPEFVIPGSSESSRRASCCSSEIASVDDEISFRAFSPRSSIESAKTSPCFSPIGSNVELDVPNSHGAVKSCPVSPRHEVNKPLTGSGNSKSLGCIGDTNSDPLSIAAMSLPHFKARTSFGFSTLSQAPHTRRKESLFHMNGEGLLSARDSRRLKSLESLAVRGRPEMLDSFKPMYESERKLNQNTPSVIVTPSATQNAKASPLKSSPEHRSSGQFLSASRSFIKNDAPNMRNFKKSNRYYRRRSSLVLIEPEAAGSSDESTRTGDSSAEQTPDLKRKSLTSLQQSNSRDTSPSQPKRHSAPLIGDMNTFPVTDDHSKTLTCDFLAEHGELKFAFQFLAASKVLKLTLIKAEHLGGHGKYDSNMNAYAKVYLMPGKIQKQTSEIHKHTRNPVFNQEFYFQGLSLHQLHSLNLRIKIFHKGHNLKLPEFVGKVDLELDSFDLLTENRMWKDLDGKREREDLGSIELGLRFDPHEGTLSVTVMHAKGLPQHQITGAPNPYVRVEVNQPSRSVSRKQTKTKKNTAAPVYNETFTFSISPKVEDMEFTFISIVVFDYERIRSDDFIGQVRLGYGSSQETEVNHWNEALNNSGTDVTALHYLVDMEDE